MKHLENKRRLGSPGVKKSFFGCEVKLVERHVCCGKDAIKYSEPKISLAQFLKAVLKNYPETKRPDLAAHKKFMGLCRKIYSLCKRINN